MTIEKAFKKTTGLEVREGIKKAIEGGYVEGVYNEMFAENYPRFFLDPNFWKAYTKYKYPNDSDPFLRRQAMDYCISFVRYIFDR